MTTKLYIPIPLALLIFIAPMAHAYAEPLLDIIPPDEYLVTELGDSQSFGIALKQKPDSKVILKLAVSDASEAKLDKTELTFLRENWNDPQIITVTGLNDTEADGNVPFDVSIKLDYTKDKNYLSLATQTLSFECLDDENPIQTVVSSVLPNAQPDNKKHQKIKVRIVTANTTSGEEQSYDDGEGIRIFKALKPDIILIQEFNYHKNSIKSFVASTFGPEYQYYRGTGDIPNGIITHYPILQTGSWKSNKVKNRQWDWAVIDIPGPRDLLAISVHLYTQDNEAEMEPLRKQIEKKIKEDNKNYYIMLGGDFNQESWDPIDRHFSSMFEIGKKYQDWPADQEGYVKTNATRHKQIDYLLCNPDLCALETPVIIGKHTYPKGHVLDSRVYKKLGEMKDIAPVKADDSAANKMQHMAVVRDFIFTE